MPDADDDSRVGLCSHCRHADTVTTSRGATFYLCRLSVMDQRFPKYPTLPVLSCGGYASMPDPIDPTRTLRD
jgi:hypothetical protein